MTTLAFGINILLFILAVLIGHKKNLADSWVKYVLLSLICVGSAAIFSFLSYHAVLVLIIPLLFAIQYRRKNVIWFTYAVNMLTMIVSSFISFFYGICDLNILFKSQHVRAWYMDMIAAGTYYQTINDEYGHDIGDKAIRRLAAALITQADNHCRVYRIGGDEFLMIIEEPKPDEPEMLIQSVRGMIEKENDNDELFVSSAAGYAFGSGKNILEVVRSADANMYMDKKGHTSYMRKIK